MNRDPQESISERLDRVSRRKQDEARAESVLQSMGSIMDLVADDEARRLDIRRFMAWLEEKTGFKAKPIRHVRTKFDRQKWEEFRATLKKDAVNGPAFEAKRRSALVRVAEYYAQREGVL